MMPINAFVDHTVLKPFAKRSDIEKLCREAIAYKFCAVCVSPFHVCVAAKLLENSDIKLATVIGFPYGYETKKNKIQAIEELLPIVDEFDVVVNLQALSDENYAYLRDEMTEITEFVHTNKKVVKFIVESGNITHDQLKPLCDIANDAEIDFMKTSTGMLGAGASIDDVQFMREHLKKSIQIKASGGIRDVEFARALIEAGATRIGASSLYP